MCEKHHGARFDLSENLVAGLHAAVQGDFSVLKTCGEAELERIGGVADQPRLPSAVSSHEH